MGFLAKGAIARSDGSMDYEISKLAHSMSALILRSVDGSNPLERKLIADAKQLGDIANGHAGWRLTSSYLLAVCDQATRAIDCSTEAERHVYCEAYDLVQQFDYSKASCA